MPVVNLNAVPFEQLPRLKVQQTVTFASGKSCGMVEAEIKGARLPTNAAIDENLRQSIDRLLPSDREPLAGRVEMDDANLGGERSSGKAGRAA